MDPVSSASAVVSLAGFAGTVFSNILSYAKAVKESQKELAQLSSEIAALIGTLHSTELLIHELKSTGDTMKRISQCHELLQQINDRIKRSKADVPSHGRIKRVTKTLKWPFTLQDTKELVGKIERYKAEFNLAISSEGLLAVLRDQKETADEIRSLRQEIKARHEVEARIELNNHRKDILSFFEKVDLTEYFDTNRRLWHEGTGVWFTEGDTLGGWLASSDSNLWLYGIPGAGKTVLSATVVQKLLNTCRSDEAVAFFYCDYKKQETQDPRYIFGSLVKQLAIQSQAAFEIIQEYYAKCYQNGRGSDRLDVQQLIDLIRQMTGCFKSTSIIVDGLDECIDSVYEVLDQWTSLFQRPAGALRTIILSRDESTIRKALLDQHYISMSIAAESTDIRLYVGAEIEKRCRRGTLEIDDPSLKDFIKDKLVEKAQGMFRWVACQFDFLQDLTNENAYRSALESLPPSLPVTYERMLERMLKLPESTQRTVQETLKWVLFGEPALNISQLCEAVSVEAGSEKSNPRSIVKPGAIERHCGSFIRRSADGNYIESAHFTVKEFFLGLNRETSPRFARFSMQKEPTYVDFAITCLTYLNYEDFKRPVPHNLDEMSEYPFYDHAAAEFSYYAQECWHDSTIKRLGEKLFNKERPANFLLWCHYYIYYIYYYEFADSCTWESFLDDFSKALCREHTSTLYWAALMGIAELVETILASGGSVNNCTLFGTPLHAAILGPESFHLPRYEVPNELMLEEEGGRKLLSIGWQWNNQRRSCVELLLSHGADCSIPFVAFQACNITTYELLLYSCDAELIKKMPKPKDPLNNEWLGRLRGALSWSRRINGDLEEILCIIEMIDTSKVAIASEIDYFQYAVEVRAAANLGKWPGNASDALLLLQAAAEQGSVDVIRNILTLQSVDIDSANEDGETALHLAARTGSRQCMEVLIQHGACINKWSSKGLLPLHCAAGSSPIECIDMLIELGSDPEERTADEKSLSHLAAEGDNKELLKMLLERFGEKLLHADDRDKYGLTPVLVAAASASEAALQFLLPFSSPNDIGLDNEPLLHHAAEKLSLSGIATIIESGVDPLEKCAHGFNILHHLASNPRADKEYFQMALDFGASKDDKSVDGVSPLHGLLVKEHFSKNPKIDLAILLASEANVNFQDEDGNAPLHLLLDAEMVIDAKLRLLGSFLEIGANVTLGSTTRDSFLHELIRKLSKFKTLNTPGGIRQWSFETKHLRRLINTTVAMTDDTHYLEQPVDNLQPLFVCLVDENLSLDLLSKGVDPNLRNSLPRGYSALEYECTLDREKVNEELLSKLCEAYKQAPSLNSNGDSLLHILCKGNSCNLTLLDHIHNLIPDVNIRGADGDLSLIDSIQKGKVDFVERLLKLGARLDLKGGKAQCCWYPFHWAAVMGHHDILHLLHYHEMEWNLRTAQFSHDDGVFSGCSALHLAVLENRVTVVNFLLDRALIDLHGRDDSGRTPLHFAAQFTDARMVGNLLDRGANTRLLDEYEGSVLHCAVNNATDYEDILVLLVNSGTPQGPNKSGDTPEILAMCEGKSKAVEILRGSQADEEHESPDTHELFRSSLLARSIQSFALSKALHLGHFERFKDIASTPGQSIDGSYACCGTCSLFLASLSLNQATIAKWLLDSGCNPRGQLNCGPRSGYTAVHLAARDPELSRDLLPTLLSIVDLDEWDTSLFSPLHVSIASRNVCGTTVLLQFMTKATDVERQDKRGISILMSRVLFMKILNQPYKDCPNGIRPKLDIIDPRDQNLAAYLASGFTGTPLHLAAFLNEVDPAMHLLQSGADFDIGDAYMWTPLHHAARSGHLELVRLLLDCRSNPNKRTRYGLTALMLAAQSGSSDVFKALLAYGVNIHAQDANGGAILEHCWDPYTYSLVVTTGCRRDNGAFSQHCINGFVKRTSLLTYIINSRSGDDHEPVLLEDWLKITPKIFRMLLRLSRIKYCSQIRKNMREQAKRFLVPAALRGNSQLVETICVELKVTDVNPLTEALVRAASWGRMSTVKSLLRRIRLYTANRFDTNSLVYMASKDFPDIQEWILVGQATDQLAIEAEGQHLGTPNRIEPWSGIRQIEIPLEERYGRARRSLYEWVMWLYSQDKEQMIAYSRRRCRLR